MTTPRVISLDIETYGATERDYWGNPNPPQTLFHPTRCCRTDRVPLQSLISTVAVTVPKEDPRCLPSARCPFPAPSSSSSTKGSSLCSSSAGSWCSSTIASLIPHQTFILKPGNPKDLHLLHLWLAHADTLIGKDLHFDLPMLRAAYPTLRPLLSGHHTLLDISWLSFVHSDVRLEKSLKTIGPALNSFIYDEADLLSSGIRYKSPHDPALHNYNGQDTHNSILGAAALARLILADYPADTARLSPTCISIWSRSIWLAIRMIEAGIPIHRTALLRAHHLQESIVDSAMRRVSNSSSSLGTPCPPDSLAGFTSSSPSFASPHASVPTLCKAASLPSVEQSSLSQMHTTGQRHTQTTPSSQTSGELPAPLEIPCDSLSPSLPSSSVSPSSSSELPSLWDSLPSDPSTTETPSSNGLSSSSPPSSSPPSSSSSPPSLPALVLTKTGKSFSPASRQDFIIHLIQEIDSLKTDDFDEHDRPISLVQKVLGTDSITLHPLCVRTKKKGEISTSAPLRALLLAMLPKDHEARPILKAWAEHTTAHGNISKYTAPLLHRRRTNCKQPLDSILLPQPTTRGRNLSVQITYPRWYMVPGGYKDDSSDRGGQKQVRPSAQAPQCQQFPPEIFECLCSRFIGGSILGPDLSQIELRTAGLLSGDESLLQNYRDGRDLHSDRAVYIFGPSVTSEPSFKSGLPTDKRQWSKTLNFEDLYMAGAAKMQQKLLEDSGIIYPLSFFEEVVRSRRELRPGLVEWQWNLIRTAERQGYIELPITGHGRIFFGGLIGANKPNEVVNFPVQAFAALTMRDIALDVCDHLPPLSHPDPPILFFMDRYDACYIDCKPGYEEEARTIYANAVRRCATSGLWGQMQDLLGREVPLKYDMKTLPPPLRTLP